MEIMSHQDLTSSPWKEIKRALVHLNLQCMSSDETDNGAPEKRVRRIRLTFLNRDFSTLFARLDAFTRDGKVIKKDQRGNRVLLRIYENYHVNDHRVVRGLPRNWYDPDWWRSLPVWEQSAMRAIEPIPIPTLDI